METPKKTHKKVFDFGSFPPAQPYVLVAKMVVNFSSCKLVDIGWL